MYIIYYNYSEIQLKIKNTIIKRKILMNLTGVIRLGIDIITVSILLKINKILLSKI